MTESDKANILKANIDFHTALARDYDATQPHFLPENVSRVEQLLSSFAARTRGSGEPTLLDLGTGTGFIVNIAKRHFGHIIGVDATPAMLEKVDRSGARIELHTGNTESMDFIPDGSARVVTAYGFLHHLFDLTPTIRESFRCLSPGGVFYSDQDPNSYFWDLMHRLQGRDDLPPIVARELSSVTEMIDDIARDAGITSETVQLAEFQKVKKGGLDPDQVVALLKREGFRTAEARFEWYLGEGQIRRMQGPEIQERIGAHLRSLLPATRHLFKYVAFVAEK